MIVVIADDLSGAAELAGMACRHGFRAEVQTSFSSASDADVICVDTDSRSLSQEQAAQKVGLLSAQIAGLGPAWIFKKCDSVLRGPVLAEARAVARAFGRRRIVVVPANPSRGRIVRKGTYFVKGIPLHETMFAADPERPRMTSRVTSLLDGDRSGVFIPDTESIEEVRRQASLLDHETLPVGAADFFEALLQHREPRGSAQRPEIIHRDPAANTVLVCGSAAAWPARRAEAEALGIPVFARPYDRAAAIHGLRSAGRIIIGVGDASDSWGKSSAELTAALAQVVASVLSQTNVARLLSEGGATTAAVMGVMGWTRLDVLDGTLEGVTTLRPTGARGPRLFIKPGSYAWPQWIWPANLD